MPTLLSLIIPGGQIEKQFTVMPEQIYISLTLRTQALPTQKTLNGIHLAQAQRQLVSGVARGRGERKALHGADSVKHT